MDPSTVSLLTRASHKLRCKVRSRIHVNNNVEIDFGLVNKKRSSQSVLMVETFGVIMASALSLSLSGKISIPQELNNS